MATTLRFRIHLATAPASYLEFDADGPWSVLDPERVYREAANPPELESIRRRWELTGKIITPDGGVGSAWERYLAFVAALEVRGTGSPTKVELLQVDEDGTATSRAVLGPPAWEGFRVDEFEGLPTDVDNPPATHLTSFPVRLVVSSLKRLPVGGTGDDAAVVGFEQTLEIAEDAAGFQTVTQVTVVTTAEGTDAKALGLLLGKLDITEWGSSYSYQTNGDDGASVEVLDPDSRTGRVPTKVRVTSQIKEWGSPTGVTDPGASPGDFSKLTRTETKDGETVRTVRAGARGPGAQAWGQRQKPAGELTTDVEEYDEFKREFVGEWTIKKAGDSPFVTTVAVQLSGGHKARRYAPVTGGLLPVRFTGAIQPWRCAVAIRVERRGGKGLLEDLPLPPLLPGPWELDFDESKEGAPTPDPQEDKKAKDATTVKWVREVSLVYGSAVPPSQHPYLVMKAAAGAPVPTYYL